jgi:hypothetical protein
MRQRFGRLKGQLKFLYQRELKASRDYDEVIAALQQARERIGVPLQGFVLSVGQTTGMWPDNWVGSELQFAFRCTRPASSLKITLWAPPQLETPQEIRVEIDGVEIHATVPAGECVTITHDGQYAAEQVCPVRIHAAHTWCPAGSGQTDSRDLAWRLVEIVVE